MALDQSALLDLLAQLKLTDVTDRIRIATEMLYQELIDAEASAFIGAAPFERTTERSTHRNGTRLRTDRDLAALDYPYVFLDATYCTARVNHQIVPQVVVAVGVAADGRREVLGFDVGDLDNEAFWTGFLRSLKTRGLGGMALVMSDAHSGLNKVTNTVFQGASWQRCRVHFMRNVLAVAPKGSQDMVASVIRTVFAQPDAHHINKQFTEVAAMLGHSHPKVATMLDDARHGLLAFAVFPQRHWRQIWSTNPLELVNKEIKRRTDVARVFPNPAALLRLAGSVLIEQHDEWEAGDRRYFSAASMLELKAMNVAAETIGEVNLIPELTAAQAEATDPRGKEKPHHLAGRDPFRSTPMLRGPTVRKHRGSPGTTAMAASLNSRHSSPSLTGPRNLTFLSCGPGSSWSERNKPVSSDSLREKV